ncbi:MULTISPECIES: hypothetical protein [Paenibacillus]|uniref:hypothetical protein n=1 Tax=Paenibacillus TaxID=44249 RepID=UPI000B870805|nr:hypothetical protein [Paenibacillus amylolyticus]
MQSFKIYAGLGGGFGGANYECTEQFNNEGEAEKFAWSKACEHYESYAGSNGLRSIEDITEEEEVGEEEAEEIYNEERENWLDYYVKLDDGVSE